MKEYQSKEMLSNKYNKLGSLSKVASHYGVSKKCILNWMNRLDINRNNMRIDIDMDEALELFNGGMNAKQLAELYNVSSPTITSRFKEIGINTDRFHKGYILKDSGYTLIKCTEHPNADKKGYVPLHRLIVEKHIGRYLTKEEVVHHKDKDKDNNDIENLEILTSSQHAYIHSPQERKVIDIQKAYDMVKSGMLRKDVARIFNISPDTLRAKFMRHGLINNDKI